MRLMGLDLGDKTIGIAISDALGITAQGKGVIQRTNLEKDLQDLYFYIKKYDVEEIIVGMPRNMNGTYGIRAEKTRNFVEFLRDNLEIEIKVWDERLSTVEAEKILIKGDVSRSKRKKVIDKMAASIILKSYLDYTNNIKRRNRDE